MVNLIMDLAIYLPIFNKKVNMFINKFIIISKNIYIYKNSDFINA